MQCKQQLDVKPAAQCCHRQIVLCCTKVCGLRSPVQYVRHIHNTCQVWHPDAAWRAGHAFQPHAALLAGSSWGTRCGAAGGGGGAEVLGGGG